MRNIKIFAVLMVICFLTFGFFDRPKQFERISLEHPQQAILGIWLRENQPTDKIDFLSNGKVKRYFDNVLHYTETFSISSQCGGFTSPDEILYLHTIDLEDGNESCTLILNGVYELNGDTLTLLDDNGKLSVYLRQ